MLYLGEWPQCHVCRRKVENMHIDTDLASRALLIAVECHGQFEVARIPIIELELGENPPRIDFSVAFVPKIEERED